MSADELLTSYNCSIADMEYILQFMKNQKISPQLALRRIKAFDTLEQKMDQSKDTKEKLEKLKSEIEEMNEEFLAREDALENEIVNSTFLAMKSCPKLLEWSIAWTEILFNHAIS